MISDDTLRSTIAAALDKRAREAENISEWTWKAANACDVDPRTVEKWLYGETLPSAVSLKNLDEHFGTLFKNEHELTGSYVAARREHAEAVEDANALARCQTALVQIKGAIKDLEAKVSLRAVTP